MCIRQVSDIIRLLDRPSEGAATIAEPFSSRGLEDMQIESVDTDSGKTSFMKLLVPGTNGRRGGGKSPTMGVIGMGPRVGAPPDAKVLAFDNEGPVVALTTGLMLADMIRVGERLSGDVIVTTQLTYGNSDGPPVPVEFVCERLVDPRMDAIISIEATKGNRIVSARGFAISPTVKEGYVLRVNEALLTLQEKVTERTPAVFAVTTQDITPYANELYHLNTIVQPATVTDVPVVGLAITSESTVPASANGTSQEADIAEATRFVLEAANVFTAGQLNLYDQEEYDRLVRLYGSMSYLQAPRRVREPKHPPRSTL